MERTYRSGDPLLHTKANARTSFSSSYGTAEAVLFQSKFKLTYYVKGDQWATISPPGFVFLIRNTQGIKQPITIPRNQKLSM